MPDKLPYEEWLSQELNNLPVPDEAASWQQMKKLLEQERKKRRLLPPIWLGGCMGSMLLLLLLAGLFWFVGIPAINIKKNRPGTQAPNVPQHKTTNENLQQHYTSRSAATTSTNARIRNGSPRQIGTAVHQQAKLQYTTPTNTSSTTRQAAQTGTTTKQRPTRIFEKQQRNYSKATTGMLKKREKKAQQRNTIQYRQQQIAANQTPDTTTIGDVTKANTVIQDTAVAGKPPTGKQHDQVSDSAKAGVQEATNQLKKQQGRYFSAGLSLNQQVPLAGQKATPYNYYGGKASLADYVPAVYVRLHQGERWYVQSELRYGAPQYAKEFMYSRSKIDSFGATVTRQYLTLKKTFYHQLYLSLHHQLRSNWWLGGGSMYSRFYGAVSEQEIREQNIGTPAEALLSRKLVQVPAATDSFFTRSQWHLLLETEYRKGRFALGGRYTMGLQPFIRYNAPDGTPRKEVNRSLQVFLRFRVWEQKH